MARLITPEISSPAELGIAMYEKVQELTKGRAQRAASFLSELTCLELGGCQLPSSPWCTLVLFALSDLAMHAPGVTILIPNWPKHYHNIARKSGEAIAQEIASSLVWVGCEKQNLELETACTPQMQTYGANQLPTSATVIDLPAIAAA